MSSQRALGRISRTSFAKAICSRLKYVPEREENLFRASKVKAPMTALLVVIHVMAVFLPLSMRSSVCQNPGKSKQPVNHPDDP